MRTHRPIRRLIAALLLFELVLVCIHVGGRMAGVDHNIVRYWFDLNGEQNIPAWFSGQLLFAVGMCWAIMAWLNRARPDRGVICAVLMTAIFMYFSVDEMVGIHERIAERIDGESRRGTAFHYTGRWALLLVPIAVAVLGAVLWRMSVDYGRAIVGTIAAGGGLFLLMAGFGDITENIWDGPISHAWQVGIEELGEMVGVTIILGASLHAVTDTVAAARVPVAAPAHRPRPSSRGASAPSVRLSARPAVER